MDMSNSVAEGAQPVSAEIRERCLEPYIAAASGALAEMTGAEVSVQSVYQGRLPGKLGDIFAVVALSSASMETLVLSFPRKTAAALAGRMLAGVAAELNESLIRDCLGEIANVIAGQAKAMLAGTPFEFAACIPKVVDDAYEPPPGQRPHCLVVAFSSNHGAFAMQLHRKS